MRRPRAFSIKEMVLSAAVIGLFPVQAAAPLAWLYFNEALPGESTATTHKGWIDIHGFGVDTTRTISSGSGGPTKPEPAKVSEIRLTKALDRSSPALFREAVVGSKPFPLVKLDLNYGGNKPVDRLELENVLISSQTFAAMEGDDIPRETLSLNFTKITYYHVLPDSRTAYTSFDLAMNKATSGYEGDTEPNPDSDSDGMPDAWESTYGLSVGANDAAGDADGDGLSNIDEFQLGTHPKSGTSFFKSTLSSVPATPGSYQLTWNSVVGKAYVIEWSPDLTTPFAPVRTVTASSTTSTETLSMGGAVGFYRVRPQ